MAAGAVFDLDRTLIAGSSAPVFGQALRDVGIEMPRSPGQSTFFALYERFGEDPVSMRLARHAPRLFAGHDVATVQAAGRLAADVLASTVHQSAHDEISRHRSAGAELVLASTSSVDLLAPLAELLGIGHLICTRYRVVDGVFDGATDGAYIWGAEKAAAVAQWAGREGINLTTSTAYSDSWYDVPLLELVGKPVAVNPDVRLRVLAQARKWPIRRFREAESSPGESGATDPNGVI